MGNPHRELLDKLRAELAEAEHNVSELRGEIERLEATTHTPVDGSRRKAISMLKTAAWVAPVMIATRLPETTFDANAMSNPCNGQPPTPLTQECIDFTNGS